MNSPHINVTPLIDVLLVLLIIFMVVAPLKPSSFKARIPHEPQKHVDVPPDPAILVATIEKGSLRLNNEESLGTPDDPAPLIERLQDIFRQREVNGNVSSLFAEDPERPQNDRIERTVFVKAPPSLDYGSVARVIDAVKQAGAFPISLQIDGLDHPD